METRRLELLVELARLGSMGAVAYEMGTSTSTVSQQLGALARETGATLIEPVGRRVRLTPAGRRLATRAVDILAALEAARRDLDPGAEAAGTVHVSGFATAIRRTLLPIVAGLARSHPDVHVVVYEHEPAEAFALLDSDEIDLALTYDYNLAPTRFAATVETVALWSTRWSLGVPSELANAADPRRCRDARETATPTVAATGSRGVSSVDVVRALRGQAWIGNSRNRADEVVVRALASMAGFQPNTSHQCDSLDLVEDLIVAGLGVGLLPADRVVGPGVALVPLIDPEVSLRAYAVTRRGRASWAPLALLLSEVGAARTPTP